MKKFLLFLFALIALSLLLVYVLVFVPLSTPYEKGPKAHYRVEEGAIEVFALKNGKVRSLLGFLKPGESLTAPMVSDASLTVPFWLNWIEPLVVDAVGRARYFMYKEGKKAKYNEFTVGYTNQTIRKGFVRDLERSGLLKNIQLDFSPDGFSFSAKALGLSITARGAVSVPGGAGDSLLLHLRWLKIGSATMPENVLRSIENVFASAYENSGSFPIKLLHVTFKDKTIVMSFRKTAGSDTGTMS